MRPIALTISFSVGWVVKRTAVSGMSKIQFESKSQQSCLNGLTWPPFSKFPSKWMTAILRTARGRFTYNFTYIISECIYHIFSGIFRFFTNLMYLWSSWGWVLSAPGVKQGPWDWELISRVLWFINAYSSYQSFLHMLPSRLLRIVFLQIQTRTTKTPISYSGLNRLPLQSSN